MGAVLSRDLTNSTIWTSYRLLLTPDTWFLWFLISVRVPNYNLPQATYFLRLSSKGLSSTRTLVWSAEGNSCWRAGTGMENSSMVSFVIRTLIVRASSVMSLRSIVMQVPVFPDLGQRVYRAITPHWVLVFPVGNIWRCQDLPQP